MPAIPSQSASWNAIVSPGFNLEEIVRQILVEWIATNKAEHIHQLNPDEQLEWLKGTFQWGNKGTYNETLSELLDWYGAVVDYDMEDTLNLKPALNIRAKQRFKRQARINGWWSTATAATFQTNSI